MIWPSFHDPRTYNMQHKMWTKPTPRRVKWITIQLHVYQWLEFGLPIIDHACIYFVALERVVDDHCKAPLWLITRTGHQASLWSTVVAHHKNSGNMHSRPSFKMCFEFDMSWIFTEFPLYSAAENAAVL